MSAKITSYLLTAFIIPSLSILNIWRLGGSINSEQKPGPWAEKYGIHVFLWDVKEPKHYSKKSRDPDDCTWGGWVRLATLSVNARSLTSSNCSSINKVDVFPRSHCCQTFAESFPGNRKSRLACLAQPYLKLLFCKLWLQAQLGSHRFRVCETRAKSGQETINRQSSTTKKTFPSAILLIADGKNVE